MLLIAARYYELPQWNNNLKSLDSDIVPVQVRLAAPKKVRILYLYLFYFLRIISTKTLQVTICTKEF